MNLVLPVWRLLVVTLVLPSLMLQSHLCSNSASYRHSAPSLLSLP
jgi:hypothetical protein